MEGLTLRSMRAIRDWAQTGKFDLPAEVRECTERFWRSTDPFEAWQAERVVLDPAGSVPAPQLHMDYKSYCLANGSKNVLGRNRFYDKLAGLDGVWRDEANAARPFRGLRLTEYGTLAAVEDEGLAEAAARVGWSAP